MTLEQYQALQKLPEIPFPAWFEYYQERGGILPYEKFVDTFSTLMWNKAVVRGSNYSLMEITLQSALNNFFNYYNKKFAL